MITKKTKYALKALATLAQGYEYKKPILIADLASKDRIPKKFLELILLELKNKGILRSKKGKGGGYLLSREPGQIQLITIMRTLEGPLAPLACLSRTAHAKCAECVDEAKCGLKMVMKEVYEMQVSMLERLTLRDLISLQELLNRETMAGSLIYEI